MSPTSIEIAIDNLLTEMGIAFVSQEQIERWSCDFYVPSANLVIECDGDYWHQLPSVQRKDAIKDTWLKNNGYSVLHLSEDAIRKRLSECKKQILIALQSQPR
jgi:very-short-patch-repair endonuclease